MTPHAPKRRDWRIFVVDGGAHKLAGSNDFAVFARNGLLWCPVDTRETEAEAEALRAEVIAFGKTTDVRVARALGL